jgi:hemerythrin-like domain-containing protein
MAESDAGLASYFTRHHRLCDAGWAAVERAVQEDDEAVIVKRFAEYDRLQRLHLSMEEGLMFPAFEERTGMTGGPTQVMRMEHQQMRGLLDQMAAALELRDFQELLDQGDTLLMLIQQHNQKEEGILYPMADQALSDQWPALCARLEELASG